MLKGSNKVKDIISVTTEKLKEINGGQVTGDPLINERGQTVTPVSDMTVAVFCGGGDYGNVKSKAKDSENFAGGCAVICSLKPNNFILDNGNGYEITKANNLIDNISLISDMIVKSFKK